MEAQSRRIGTWVIDVGVPTPKARAPHKTKYPFSDMQVDESFVLPKKKVDNCRSAANQFCRRTQMTWKFSVGKADGDEYRCWRIK